MAILFGIGMGLTLDEFALWLNLQDVYWSQKGRQSIDAVIVAALLLVVGLLGLSFWIDLYRAGLVLVGIGDESFDRGDTALFAVPLQLLALAFAMVCFAKGKLLTGLAGIGIPLVGLIGSIRLAKPHSLWGRRYTGEKREQSLARFAHEEPPGRAGRAGARERLADGRVPARQRRPLVLAAEHRQRAGRELQRRTVLRGQLDPACG